MQKKEGSPKPTRLLIERTEGTAHNAGNDVVMKMRELFLSRNNDAAKVSFYSLKDLSRTQSLEVVMNTENGTKTIELPDGMLDRIAEYLRSDALDIKNDFDCGAFAHFVNNVPHVVEKFDTALWSVYSLKNETVLHPGDTVITVDGDGKTVVRGQDIKHFAIYLGDGLYISKFGTVGPLIVTTLEEMKKGFGDPKARKSAFQIVPNKEV
ncbi:MAG: hypothetical protein KBD06_01105 [Candidatus Pacebacteria bacterium]|nr:hypothetical protein [Candidatus Paceibacterota bacterium]